MIDLGATSVTLSAPTMSREDFEAYSTRLFEEWERRLADQLDLHDYSLNLEVEEGSVVAVGTIVAAIGVVYIGIGNYGSFISGLQTIRAQVREAGDYLAERAAAPFTMLNLQPRVHRRSGKLAQLERLFGRVQRHELTVEQAIQEAETVLGPDAIDAPEFMQSLGQALSSVRRHPEQLTLPMELPEELPPQLGPDGGSPSRPRRQRPTPPPRQQLRVEVWRESKTGKRQIRITEL